MISEIYAPAQRLLTLPDRHGALLAEFDFYPEQDLLWVRWHGHVTGASVIAGAQAGLGLHPEKAPRCILNDKSRTTGNWEEAMPWLHYDWLPQVTASGMSALAYVLSPDPAAQPAAREFLQVVRERAAVGLFRNPGNAWQWLLRQ